MSHVIYEALNRQQFLRLPRTDPPLEYRDGMVVRAANGRVIFQDMTLEQFLRLPEAKPALEYIDGTVVQKVPPKATHSGLQYSLGLYLGAFSRRKKLGRPWPELRCTFAGRSIVPDLAFFARGRLPRDRRGRPVDDVFLAPDLTIEIISPGQTVKALSARSTWCVDHGVHLCWVIQPRRDRVYVFRRGQPPEILELGDTLAGSGVLPDFALPLKELFGWLLEDA
jgi:Uma2 family endonuclease